MRVSEPKGPKVELPPDLAAELADSGVSPDGANPKDGAKPEDAEQREDGDAGSGPEEVDLSGEIEALRDQHLRLAAEFENFKRRTARERQDQLNYGNESLIKELLGTVDNLERALGHGQASEQGSDPKSLLAGVELTHRALLQVLEKFGVQPVLAEGEPFDPQLHEAVGQVPRPEVEAGTVVEVLQNGYLLRDRLVRPALVVVSTKTEDGSD